MELEQPSGDSAPETAPTEAVENLDTSEGSPETELTAEEQAAQQAVEDEIEEEFEGIKARGKKEAIEKLKSERLMQADYTRKTQEVADNRKSFEQEREAFVRNAQMQQQYLDEVAEVRTIDRRLAQFAQVNWPALTDQDPVQALKLHTEFTQLQAAKGQLVNALTQKQQQASHMQQRETAKQLMEARQTLERDIKGWSPELAGKLAEFGIKQGFPPEAMDKITNPAIVKLLHKAFMFDQLEQTRKAKPPATPANPVTRISGASAATTAKLSEVSDAEFARRRREYISKHR